MLYFLCTCIADAYKLNETWQGELVGLSESQNVYDIIFYHRFVQMMPGLVKKYLVKRVLGYKSV